MATQFNEEEFISLCAKGSLEVAEKKLRKDNININCKEKESNSHPIQLSIQQLTWPPPTIS